MLRAVWALKRQRGPLVAKGDIRAIEHAAGVRVLVKIEVDAELVIFQKLGSIRDDHAKCKRAATVIQNRDTRDVRSVARPRAFIAGRIADRGGLRCAGYANK